MVLKALVVPERLSELETVIARGLSTFVEVGLALLEIRDSRLYRAAHETFESYCRERWGWSRRHANRLIEASEVLETLGPIGPIHESQVRELVPLARADEDAAREVWRDLREQHGEKLTAADVREAVEAHLGRRGIDVHFSSETPEWCTPPGIITRARSALGGIDLDPCSNSGEPNVPAKRHFTEADDGLAREWSGRVYMNPPYGAVIAQWVTKLRDEFAAGRVKAAIALVPARTDTEWFAGLRDCALCFIHGRLRFSNSEAGAPFPSVLAYFGPDRARFARAFGDMGDVWQRVSR
jgi:phage N-6-adenine-methyltransferase